MCLWRIESVGEAHHTMLWLWCWPWQPPSAWPGCATKYALLQKVVHKCLIACAAYQSRSLGLRCHGFRSRLRLQQIFGEWVIAWHYKSLQIIAAYQRTIKGLSKLVTVSDRDHRPNRSVTQSLALGFSGVVSGGAAAASAPSDVRSWNAQV